MLFCSIVKHFLSHFACILSKTFPGVNISLLPSGLMALIELYFLTWLVMACLKFVAQHSCVMFKQYCVLSCEQREDEWRLNDALQ